jgi:deaminated glutathione amidase
MSEPAAGILRVACVQLNSRGDKGENVAAAARLVEEAAAAGARLVALPETWTFKGSHAGIIEAGEWLDGPSAGLMRDLATTLGIYLLAGSFYERMEGSDLLSNTSVLFGPTGERLAVYRKIHLFDVTVGDTVYRESETLQGGHDLVTAEIDGVTAGLTICYDVRFPELYRALALRGARVFLAPSAFTQHTGRAHWEILVRARAIENGCYMIAPDQSGEYLPGRRCWGHSMIVDPWGRVLAVREEGVGLCVADLDLSQVDEVRKAVPALQHRRPDAYGSLG